MAADCSLQLVPVDWQTVRGFVADWHRHHKPPVGYLWAHGVAAGDELVGVAIVGRPVARQYDDGRTVEVTRSATDGYPNANSMLYGACARAAFAKGYRRVITYTQPMVKVTLRLLGLIGVVLLPGESGASLKAANYKIVAQRPPRKGWTTPSRPRDDRGVDGVPRTLWEAI